MYREATHRAGRWESAGDTRVKAIRERHLSRPMFVKTIASWLPNALPDSRTSSQLLPVFQPRISPSAHMLLRLYPRLAIHSWV
jgi:hypothetical protein